MRSVIAALCLMAVNALAQTDLLAEWYARGAAKAAGLSYPTPYFFYNFSSNLLDSSGNGHDATNNRAMVYTNYGENAWVPAKSAYADAAIIPQNPIPRYSQGAVAFWIFCPYKYNFLLPIAINDTTNKVIRLASDNSGYTVRFYIYGTNGAASMQNNWTPASTATNWMHLTYSWAMNSGIALYTNGVLAVQSAPAANSNNYYPYFSNLVYTNGNYNLWHEGGYGYPGDRLMWWTNALTSNDVRSLYLSEPSANSLFGQ